MSKKSLIGLPTRRNTEALKINALSATKKRKSFKSNSILDKINEISTTVRAYLGKYAKDIEVIRDIDTFNKYIDKAIEKGYLAIDTETDGLDVINDKIVGLCFYVPGHKAAYVPVRHKSYITGTYLPNQLSITNIKPGLDRIKENKVKIVYHHGKFDMRVIYNNFKVKLGCYWDTMIGAKIINQNESAALKFQHAKYVNDAEKEYDFGTLFRGIDYKLVPIEVAALYAASDPLITWELHEHQKKVFNQPGNENMYKLFRDIETPLVEVVTDMENTGIRFDFELAERLSNKYHKLLDKAEKAVYAEIDKYSDQIRTYKIMNPDHKLSDPILLSSPAQLATLFYDILKLESPDSRKPRGTGEDIIKGLNLPMASALLEYRGIQKLLTTYIDKLPNSANKATGRIHASFNQVGADTGRFSSSDPNLQNIPSYNKEIRLLFRASEGHKLVASDFSQQEPRVLAHFSGDEHMIDAYNKGQDLYATVASRIYGRPYNECLARYPDGSPNPEGARLRENTKSIVLGLMYGRGPRSIAEQTGQTLEEAQQTINTFYQGFPKVRQWMDDTVTFAKKYGYAETLWGRRRYIPDIQLKKYELTLESGNRPVNFNPLFGFETVKDDSQEKLEYFETALNNARYFNDRIRLKQEAENNGIKVKDNNGFIAEGERQAVNSRIQGSSADMSKRAMLLIAKDERMKEMGFRLLLAVHDELIGEVPEEHAEEAAQRLSDLMIESALPECSVAMKCDAEITRCWYEGDYINYIRDEYKKSNDIEEVIYNHEEIDREIIIDILQNNRNTLF